MEILLFIIVLALLVLAHEFGHFVVARRVGVRVEEFGFGFPPRIFGIQKGETLYSVNAVPLGGFVKLEGEDDAVGGPQSFGAQTIRSRAWIIAAGVIANVILAWVLFTTVAFIGRPMVYNPADSTAFRDIRVHVSDIAPASPAERAGFALGDVIVAVGSRNETRDVSSALDIQQFISSHIEGPVTFTIRRGEATQAFEVFPRKNPPAGEGAVGIGMFEVGLSSLPWYKAPIAGLQDTYRTFTATIIGLWQVIAGIFSDTKVPGGVVGPVGIAGLVSDTGALGISFLLQLIAVLSVNLAILNVLPIPALDGGRLFFLLIEKIRGKPIPSHIPRLAHAIGFAALLALLIVVTYFDIARLVG